MKSNVFLAFLLITIAMVFGLSSVSAEPAPVPRPKIGLALGGGSALGLAHIGVLQWLEENHIPVDYVSGTSMGGLIGGCFATGMSAEEIRAFIATIDWNQLFDFAPPFNRLNFRRKEDALDFPFMTAMGWRHGSLKIPQGLGVYRVGLLLSRISFPYSNLDHFGQLPTPFRCVATDITNSKKVVMGEGSLAEALRATMAIPGVFTPVNRNGLQLVDGGIVDNLPVDVAKEMGADIVIAVHLNGNAKDGNDINHQFVLMGTINTLVETNSQQSMKLANIVLEPQNSGLNVISWNQTAQLIQNGYQAAAAQAEALRKFSLDEAAWRQYCRERQQRRVSTAPIPVSIEITGANTVNEVNIRRRLQSYLGKPIDTAALEEDLTDIMGSCLYENIRYECKIKNDIPVLAIIVTEKAYGPPFVNFAFAADSDNIMDEQANIYARFRFTTLNLTGPNSEWRTDLGLGAKTMLMSELYQPLAETGWFIAPAISYDQQSQSLFSGDTQINTFQSTGYRAGMDLGYNFNDYGELRVGYFAGRQSNVLEVGQALPDGLDGVIRESRLKWRFNNTNESWLATKGIAWDLDLHWYDTAPGSSGAFGQLDTKVVKIFPVGEDLVSTALSGGDTFHGNAPLTQQFRLGGPFRLGCYRFDQLRGENYLLGNIGYLKLYGNFEPLGRIYWGVYLEHGGTFDSWSSMDLKTCFSTGFFGSTLIGPLYLGVSYGGENRLVFNLILGHTF